MCKVFFLKDLCNGLFVRFFFEEKRQVLIDKQPLYFGIARKYLAVVPGAFRSGTVNVPAVGMLIRRDDGTTLIFLVTVVHAGQHFVTVGFLCGVIYPSVRSL